MEDVQTPSLGTFIIACACATLGLMVSLCFTIFHLYHRNNRIVKMTSPRLNVIISLGAMILCISCFLFGLDFILEGNLRGLSALCQTRVWLITCSISVVFGPVIAKTWRVYQIFKYGAVKRVIIKDSRLFLTSLCIVIIDVIIMCLWQIIDPMVVHHNQHIEETLRPVDVSMPRNISLVLQECVCLRLPLWISIFALWKLVICSQALVLAWKIRNVTVPTLNDSSSTMAAVFGTVLLTLVGLTTSSTFQKNPNAVYILTTILISGSIVWIQIVLFLPKIHYWWKNSSAEHSHSVRISSTSIKDSGTGSEGNGEVTADVNSDSFEDDGIAEIVEENKMLKQSLLEKQEYISTLQQHLDTAKEKLSSLPVETDDAFDSDVELDKSKDENMNDCNIYETLRSPKLTDRSAIYRVDGLSTTENTDFESVDGCEDHSKHETKFKHYPSIRSWSSRKSFVEEFTDIRNTVAAELSTAQAINTELKDFYNRDIQRSVSETEWLYERNNSEDLASSIAQSYDLDSNQETISYLNTYIPRENNVYQIRSRKRSSSIISVNSSDTYSQVSVEIESSDVASDVPSVNRQNSTPNSQQHAAILRYYSYRHMNQDKFTQYMMGRYGCATKEKYFPKIVANGKLNRNGETLAAQAIYNKKLNRFNMPTDSFV